MAGIGSAYVLPTAAIFITLTLLPMRKIFQIGEPVKAGQILGYMGDTGYGEEGTAGKFPVHLHLGIYIDTQAGEELGVNPYYVLQAMEKKSEKIHVLITNFSKYML